MQTAGPRCSLDGDRPGFPPKETLLAASILRILPDHALFVVRGLATFLGAAGDPYAKVGLDSTGRAGIDWGVYGVPETSMVRWRWRDRLQGDRADQRGDAR